MTELAKEARREYMRRWRQENRDRVAAYNAKFYEKQAQERKKTEENREREEAAS